MSKFPKSIIVIREDDDILLAYEKADFGSIAEEGPAARYELIKVGEWKIDRTFVPKKRGPR